MSGIATQLFSVFLKIAKFSALLFVTYTFMTAVNTIISFIGVVASNSIIGEVFGIISACLPFNALAVFGAISNVISAILAFLLARKIFNLYKENFAVIG